MCLHINDLHTNLEVLIEELLQAQDLLGDLEANLCDAN